MPRNPGLLRLHSLLLHTHAQNVIVCGRTSLFDAHAITDCVNMGWVPRLHSDLPYTQTYSADWCTKSRVHGAGATDAEASYNLSFKGVRTNPQTPLATGLRHT